MADMALKMLSLLVKGEYFIIVKFTIAVPRNNDRSN